MSSAVEGSQHDDLQGAVALTVGSVPRRIVPELLHFYENEQSIKLTQFKNGPTWDRSYC